jgi:hypothetical protein
MTHPGTPGGENNSQSNAVNVAGQATSGRPDLADLCTDQLSERLFGGRKYSAICANSNL